MPIELSNVDWSLWIPIMLTLGAPTAGLMADRILAFPAPKFFKTIGIVSLAVFVITLTSSIAVNSSILQLILWGAVGGLLGTIALDIVRLTGVRLGEFPADMPKIFGMMWSGVAAKFMGNVIANLVKEIANMPEQQRNRMIAERVQWLSNLPDDARKMMMLAMMRGIEMLPDDKREVFVKSQIEALSTLPAEKRSVLMRTMDELVFSASSENIRENRGVIPAKLRMATPGGHKKMPKISVQDFFRLFPAAFSMTLKEEKISAARILFLGYLWHFINGATYGIAYTMLFGRGSWTLAILWGIFVFAVMMAVMPTMMPAIRFNYPRFFIFPFMAHIAMIVPLAICALYFMPAAASSASPGYLIVERFFPWLLYW
ncbi:hypothetical protein HRbin02_00948 [Candidatus Calditenuaceae archaeon HR02]|nr:hypothetical protein HRbin02_00948 [Candidatus Calditenuaceae archaeon HR02]